MSDDLYFLSNDDIELLRQLVRAFKQSPRNTRNRLAQEDELGTTPEVYVAYTPAGGIPALGQVGTGTGSGVIGPEVTPGSAKCPVYQLIDSSGSPKIIKTGFDLQTIYNFSTVAVAGDSWVLAVRDKFGSWIVSTVFSQPNETWISVPIAPPQTITLSGGEQVLAYQAITYTYDSVMSPGQGQLQIAKGPNGIALQAWWISTPTGSLQSYNPADTSIPTVLPPLEAFLARQVDTTTGGNSVFAGGSSSMMLLMLPNSVTQPFVFTSGLPDSGGWVSSFNVVCSHGFTLSGGDNYGGQLGPRLDFVSGNSNLGPPLPPSSTGWVTVQSWFGDLSAGITGTSYDRSLGYMAPTAKAVLAISADSQINNPILAAFGIINPPGALGSIGIGLYTSVSILNPYDSHIYTYGVSGGIITTQHDDGLSSPPPPALIDGGSDW